MGNMLMTSWKNKLHRKNMVHIVNIDSNKNLQKLFFGKYIFV